MGKLVGMPAFGVIIKRDWPSYSEALNMVGEHPSGSAALGAWEDSLPLSVGLLFVFVR